MASQVATPQPAQNAFKSIVRSLTPWLTSTVAASIAHFGYHVSNVVAAQIIVVAGAALTVVLHALETQFPWIGVFLGYIGAPVYAPSGKTSLKAQVATLESQLAALTATAAESAAPSVPTAAPATTAPADPTAPPA